LATPHDAPGSVRVRFAPSPTGHLHVGGFRTALFNWMFARHHNGAYLLRIEDTDVERSKDVYKKSIMASLEWADLLPDETETIQSDRHAQHQQIIEQLLAQGKAYRCYCTQEDVSVRCKKAVDENSDFFYSYDGFCRQYTQPLDKPYVVRFAMPDSNEPISFDDLIRGRITFERSYFDDFIIARSDGRPMYNFVVVADDAFMRITHVIRGEDHISNTPKQILLYKACGYTIPQFAHLPMILGPGGHRLSKRDGAIAVLDYQQQGYLPDAFENYLVRLGWSHGDQEIFSRSELVRYFNLADVGKKGSIFDVAKLDWVNSMYIRQKSAEDLLSYMDRYLQPLLDTQVQWPKESILHAITLYKERVKTVRELKEAIITVWRGPSILDKEIVQQNSNTDTAAHIAGLVDLLEKSEWTEPSLTPAIKNYVAQQGIKFVDLAKPVRVALTGSNAGPGISELLMLIGKQESIHRLTSFNTTLRACN
jgi:glutamyl-tRNA synthetase